MAMLNGVPSPAEAASVLRETLPAWSPRLAHSLAVGRKAEAVTSALKSEQACLVVAAAFLHDVGYAVAAAATGMHQLDGARYLRGLGGDDALCRVVAHHTFAWIEARNRGLGGVLEAEFPLPDGDLADLLNLVTFCDLTTSSDGTPVTVSARFAGIFKRYAPEHVVSVTMREAEPLARDLVERVQQRLNGASIREHDAARDVR